MMMMMMMMMCVWSVLLFCGVQESVVSHLISSSTLWGPISFVSAATRCVALEGLCWWDICTDYHQIFSYVCVPKHITPINKS